MKNRNKKKNDAYVNFLEICTFLFFVSIITFCIIGQL